MFLSTPAKIFSAICFLSLVFAGCSLWRSNENSAVTFASEPKSEFPFIAHEPEVFQAELVVRTGEIERRTLIARNGEMRRMDFDVGTDNRHAVLITDKEYLLYFKRMTFEERELSSNAAEQYEPLTAQMLNLRDYASFDEIGRDGSVVQFKARVNESRNSEVLIFFDESIGLPVREEFYSIEGDQRTLQYSVELRDFRRDVQPELFTVPPDFRRQARNK
jgi:hypothetical protein